MKFATFTRLIALLLAMQLVVLAAPSLHAAPARPGSKTPIATSWTEFTPAIGQWIGAVPAAVAVTATNAEGLTDTAAFRFSVDSGNTWTDWLTSNLQVDAIDSTSRRITATQLALSEGINFIQFRIVTQPGSNDASPAYPLYVDTTAPPAALNPLPRPPDWSKLNAFGADWTNPYDPTGIGGVWFKMDSPPATLGDGTFVAGDNLTTFDSATVTGDGEHVLWFWLADGLGHSDPTTAVSVTVKYDTTPPGALASVAGAPEAWSPANSFDLSWSSPTDISGISGVRYKLDSPPVDPDDGEFLPGALSGFDNFAIPGAVEGSHQLYLWPVDGAGNGALPASARAVTLRLDQTPPSPPVAVPQVVPSGWQTATTTTYTVSWQNPADLSGIAGACYKLGTAPVSPTDGACVEGANLSQIAGITAPAPGSFHLFLWLQDGAGNSDQNRRSTALDAVRWDPAAPELFVDATGTPGLNGWYRGPIDLSLIATDVGSGLAAVQYNLNDSGFVSGRQLQITDDGEHGLVARATDVAGNLTQIGPLTYLKDSQPPQTTIALDQTPAVGIWFTSPVTATLTATDTVSGVNASEWRLDGGPWQQGSPIPLNAEGEHKVEYRSTDVAGNQEVIREWQVGIDLSPPVTSFLVLPTPAASGWFTQPVSVTLVPADDGAGVANTFYRVDGGAWQVGTSIRITESGEHAVEFYSVDVVGQQEAPYHIPGGIRIDRDAPRAPTPIGVAPAGWTNRNEFDLLMAVPPDLSGIDGAFIKVGAPPTSDTDGVWRPGSASVIENVKTPGEGVFKAYVWLRDVAGNVDSARRGVWEQAFALAYDGSPPATEALLTGTPGEHNWFTSPVTVTLAATDTHSGVASTSVSIDGGAPTTQTLFSLSTPDKHTLRFNSTDAAGNTEIEQFVTVRIDPFAPASPIGVATSPQDWSRMNSFGLTWTNPTDTSGIAAGYYKVGAPPTHPRDGVSIPPTGNASGITVPGAGAWDIHFWLVDQAGNADLSTRVTRSGALRFDNVAPATTTTVLEGIQGTNGWYTSRVVVRLAATDDISGVHSLRYRIGSGDWIEAVANASLAINTTGQHVLEYQATDAAGNIESIRQMTLKLDLAAPWPSFEPVSRYQRQTSFLMAWNAGDQPQGSGLDGFDLQVRDGRNGAWQPWGAVNVPDTSGRFYGNLGHRYFFRMRARDNAGNVSAWSELPWGVYIDRVVNGDFGGGSFGAWQQGGPLARKVVSTTAGPDGQTAFVAQLGSPDYGPNVPGMDIPSNSMGTIPVGDGNIRQQIRIPGADVLDRPTLSLWYRIYTYDTAYGENQQREFDTLDARLIGSSGEWLALRDGLPFDQWEAGKFADLGWRYASVEIPASWVGETATLSIENWNRIDGRLNTWTWVTDVRLWEPYHLFLPQIGVGGASVAAQTAATPPPPVPRLPDSLR